MTSKSAVGVLGMGIVLAGVLLALRLWPRGAVSPVLAPPSPVLTSYEDLTNSHFTSTPANPFAVPRLHDVQTPEFRGASAVWGGTGRDARGHVWFGVSAADVPDPSARLFEYVPDTKALFDRGDVVSELKRCGVHREGETQMKIHSKIIQGADGHLYFASMDEKGEKGDGSRPPTWGSHLWRVRLPECRWEHLFQAPEGLIAVSGVGPFLYALGYHDHVLYQYEHATSRVRSVRVGVLGGHISRNFLSDERGHAYVPRLKPAPGAKGGVESSLVEFDTNLEQVAETRLEHYLQGAYLHSHGIVGVLYLRDHSLVFVTSVGFLYRITPAENGPARVEELGWFHPGGAAYTPSLFSYEGKRYLLGVSHMQPDGDKRYHWLVYDLQEHRSKAALLELPPGAGSPWRGLLLYGSITRDGMGNFYLGGARAGKGRWRPVLFQVEPPGRP